MIRAPTSITRLMSPAHRGREMSFDIIVGIWCLVLLFLPWSSSSSHLLRQQLLWSEDRAKLLLWAEANVMQPRLSLGLVGTVEMQTTVAKGGVWGER